MGCGFDFFQKFAIKFPAHGQIIPVKIIIWDTKGHRSKTFFMKGGGGGHHLLQELPVEFH